jgi:hypothetical protein
MMAWAYGLMIYSLISMIGDLVLFVGRDRYYALGESSSDATEIAYSAAA